uniref:Uncharacterized protein n=1 Tax=Lepeophtheirus salmonis TaxID=72036 RepID=A0A0K2SYD0_LEPSM
MSMTSYSPLEKKSPNDCDDVEPQRIASLINEFVVSSFGFLEGFAIDCDERLETQHTRLHRLENSLLIIKDKLHSVEKEGDS